MAAEKQTLKCYAVVMYTHVGFCKYESNNKPRLFLMSTTNTNSFPSTNRYFGTSVCLIFGPGFSLNDFKKIHVHPLRTVGHSMLIIIPIATTDQKTIIAQFYGVSKTL